MAKKDPLTQLRAICPACFREQATRNGKMVQHGYTRPQGWHVNAGTCYGTDKPHFGTPEGRAVTADVIKMCRDAAKHSRSMAKKILDGKLPCYDRPYKQPQVLIVNPTDRDKQREAAPYESQARSEDSYGDMAKRHYDKWTAKAPRKVAVERKGPVIHLDTRRGQPECSGPYYRGQPANMTEDRTKVTCTRCIKQFAWVDARLARAKKMSPSEIYNGLKSK